MKAIEITWKDSFASGYTDVFPVETFAQDAKGADCVHLVRGPQQGKHIARCNLCVSGLRAVLDYSAFRDFNKRRGMELGRMELRFSTKRRTHVGEVRWNDRLVGPSDASVITRETQEGSIGDVVAHQREAWAQQLLRPGQARFRDALDRVYAARCCVSRCTVTWAIDAAHIQPYAEKRSNSATNGLLLRSDLHALFDAHHLAIEPSSRRVFVSDEAREWRDYRALHGKKLASPAPGFEKFAPPASAFVARWKMFKTRMGDK